MRLNRSSRALRAFVVTALMLVLLVFGVHCSSEVRVESATDVTLVLGVGTQCAPRLKSVPVEGPRGGEGEF